MLVDARTLPQGHLVEADLCIVGGGAAGITLARELLGSGLTVCLLESGGEELDPDLRTQALYAGRNVGRKYLPLDRCRTRWFGGSTNCWAGLCRPLDAIDFEARDWLPHSGWPFGLDHLLPYYRRAQPVCGLGRYAYAGADWAEPERRPMLDLGPSVVTRVFQMCTFLQFGKQYGPQLAAADDVTVYTYANVVDIDTDADARHVTGMRLACLDGPRFTVRARAYVLACGTIENARLLLAANSVVKAGLGNQHDLVGRYFMEHPHLDMHGFVQPSRTDVKHDLYRVADVAGARLMGYLTLAPDVLRAERLRGCTFVVNAVPTAVSDAHTPLAQALAPLVHEMDRGAPLPPALRPGLWVIGNACEQAPDPDSRVTLDEVRDELGMPQTVLDWRLGADDKRSLHRAHRMLADALARSGQGRFRMVVDDSPQWPEGTTWGFHHMGTTRMHHDPTRGVVDAHGRVHGTDNLFVAGASVFPTGGAANPTLTVVALALRLADRVREVLR